MTVAEQEIRTNASDRRDASAVAPSERYGEALVTVRRTLDRLRKCSDDEKQKLSRDLDDMEAMVEKLTRGRVEIVVFGEISTGKSALINALIGEAVAEVDVRGGWTKDVWSTSWNGCGYVVPGVADSEVVLIDTPGLNEVGGAARGEMAREAARRADLILFVTDGDLNETEHSALLAAVGADKPVIVALNKIDIYTREQRARLLDVLQNERLANLVPPEHVIAAAADPREVEYVHESADGKTTSRMKKPEPNVGELKAAILEVLAADGLALIALNAAMYAADKSDRIASLRVRLRNARANQIIWSFAAVKSVAVALNPYPVADVLGGTAVDAAMIAALAHVYGLDMSWRHAHRLALSIGKAIGLLTLGEVAAHTAAMFLKTVTAGWGVLVTAVPQGAAAGFGSYIVGQSAKYYFEHGASWGGEAPKSVVQRILNETDKKSVIARLKTEIKKKISINPHAD